MEERAIYALRNGNEESLKNIVCELLLKYDYFKETTDDWLSKFGMNFFRRDFKVQCFIPSDSEAKSLIPLISERNGDCLFSSASLLLAGNDSGLML